MKNQSCSIIHTHAPKTKYNFYVALLLIPSIIFVLILAFTLKKAPRNEAFATQNKAVAKNRQIKINNTTISVEIANTESKRQKGLSNRVKLNPNHGMLFIFPQKDIYPRFWMKDMFFPIDIIWINDGIITQIHKNVPAPEPNTPENELMFYLPDDPIDLVLEVPAGFSDQNNIMPGDPVDLTQAL